MKKIVYISLYEIKEADGISKKIISQCCGFSKNGFNCIFLFFKESGTFYQSFENGVVLDTKQLSKEKSIEFINKYILEIPDIEFVYIRMTNPNIKLIKLLKELHHRDIKIAYEIPTYPFLFEQFNLSHNKIIGLLKVIVYKLYLPRIYKYVNKIFIIQSNSKVKLNKKMVNIFNGISDDLSTKESNHNVNFNTLNFIGVGTIYAYHGYDRLIDSIKAYMENKNDKNVKIIFHIVGGGSEIGKLKEKVKKLGLERNIIFYGPLHGEELCSVYKKCQIGVGTLSLNKRHANIDTAIKNIEYFNYGLYVISSGSIFDVDKKYYSTINLYGSIDMLQIINDYMNYLNYSKNLDYSKLCSQFKWSNITKTIIKYMQEKE